MNEFTPTHMITHYDGERESVVLLTDNTHTDYGFRYGSVLVETPDGTRYVHFGLTNAQTIEPLIK